MEPVLHVSAGAELTQQIISLVMGNLADTANEAITGNRPWLLSALGVRTCARGHAYTAAGNQSFTGFLPVENMSVLSLG